MTKLTLNLEKDIIECAKVYAENHKRSLSKLVEDYFRKLLSEQPQEEKKYSPLVKELSGVISESDLTKTDYRAYLDKKYD